MSQGKANLVVDLGNSETRVYTIYGKDDKGNLRGELHMLDNHFAVLEDDYIIPDEYDPSNSRVFRQGLTRLCVGDLCRREFGALSDYRPSAVEKKYSSVVSEMSMRNAFLQGYIDVSRMTGIPMDKLDIEWDVSLLLPPMDLEVGAEILAKKVREIHEIDFSMPIFRKEINIKEIRLYSEGFCAYFGVVLDSNKRVRPEYMHVKDMTTIIIDIGAGTTDLIIVEKGKPVNSSKNSVALGGNNVHQRVRGMLAKKGFDMTDDAVREATEVGYIMDGNKRVSIRNEIASAKDFVSRMIVASIRDFFERTSYPARGIQYMLVCGGGAIDSIEGVSPMSVYVNRYMKRIAPNIENLEIPTTFVNGREEQISPRLLNVIGAGIVSYRD